MTTGLSSAEAADRLARDGPNVLDAAEQVSAWRKLLRQFDDLEVVNQRFPGWAGVAALVLLASAPGNRPELSRPSPHSSGWRRLLPELYATGATLACRLPRWSAAMS